MPLSQTNTLLPQARADQRDRDDRAWFLRDSNWEDVVWIFAPTNVLEEREPVRLRWDFALHAGRCFIDARYGPLLRTSQLADLVERTVPRGRAPIHPATRTFQALRIVVNRELDELDALLDQAPACLEAQGRMAVISFHSLEDRKVKEVFRAEAQSGRCADLLPGGVRAGSTEVRLNPRSRSARLRAIQRLDATPTA